MSETRGTRTGDRKDGVRTNPLGIVRETRTGRKGDYRVKENRGGH